MIISEIMIIEIKEPVRDPDDRSQKLFNCWQMGAQLALALPLCAKYTMAVAEEAPAVSSTSMTFNN